MFTNYPTPPTQQEMDHLYETSKIRNSILSVLERSHWTVPNNCKYSHAYDVDYLRSASQASNHASIMLQRVEQQVRTNVFRLKPSHTDEVEEITATAVEEMRIRFEIRSRSKPCIIMNHKAFIDLERSALGTPLQDYSGLHGDHANQIFGCPVFLVEGGDRSEVMIFGDHHISYSNMMPTTFFEEAMFGGASIYRFGPHAVEIVRRVTNLKTNTQVVLHSNFGLEPKDESMIWKMVTKS